MLTPSAGDPPATDRSRTAPALLEDHVWRRSTRSRCNAAGSGYDGRGGRRPSSRALSARCSNTAPGETPRAPCRRSIRHGPMRSSTVPVSRVAARLPQALSPGARVGTRYPLRRLRDPLRRLRAAVPWLGSRWAGARFGQRQRSNRRAGASGDPARTRDGVSRHPARRARRGRAHPSAASQRGTLAAVEPSTCPDGAATKAARLTRNSTATLT